MYGENSGQLRYWIGVLLHEHRIQQRLGGAGSHTVPETTTMEERAALGQQIRRYRQCVLIWSLEAVRAAGHPSGMGERTRPRDPAVELGLSINRTFAAASVDLAHGDDLTAPQSYATVESWRRAARAAVLGEHDFPTRMHATSFTLAQRSTVLKDAADVVRGLIVLDLRYKGVPGWEPLRSRGRLSRAAEACTLRAAEAELDYTVDRLGWQPPPAPITVQPLYGLPGVIQAQRQLLKDLRVLPTALCLRVVMESQRIIAHEIAIRSRDAAPAMSARCNGREQRYLRLAQATRDVVGIVGQQHATGTASIAATRAENLQPDLQLGATQLLTLERSCADVDERVDAALEYGAVKRLYLLRVPQGAIDTEGPGIVKGRKNQVVPIPGHLKNELLNRVGAELPPTPYEPRPQVEALRSRHDFEAALQHRPGDPGPHVTR